MLVLAPGMELAPARAHEAAGPARAVFALLAAAPLAGPVLWLQPAWAAERLMGDGVRAFLHPGRLVFGRGPHRDDLLWTAEEALRTGLVPLVVAELPSSPASPPSGGCTWRPRPGRHAARRRSRSCSPPSRAVRLASTPAGISPRPPAGRWTATRAGG